MSQPKTAAPPMIEFDQRRIRVQFGSHEVAESTDALVVREPGRTPVWYFPRRDVEMTVLTRTDHRTVSPTKGPATWFTIYRDAHIIENAVWSFENPPPPFQALAGRIAFQPVHFEFAAEGQTSADWELEETSGAPL